MSGWRRWSVVVLSLLLVACTRGRAGGTLEEGPETREPGLEKDNTGRWIITDPPQELLTPDGGWFVVHDPRPLPISKARRVVAAARVLEVPIPTEVDPHPPLHVDLAFVSPDFQWDMTQRYPVSQLTGVDELRVGPWFGRVIGSTDDVSVLNVGTLDGVPVGARFTYLEAKAEGGWTELGHCRVPLEGLYGGNAHCRPELPEGTDGPAQMIPPGNTFIRLDPAVENQGGDSCALELAPSGALAAMGSERVCKVLQATRDTFIGLYGSYGKGGSQGVYLTPMYTDSKLEDQARLTGGARTARVDLRFREWLKTADQKVLLILGGMGSGKTTLTFNLLHEQATATLAAGKGRVPVRVELAADIRPGETLAQVSGLTLISRALNRATGASVNPEQVVEDLAAGRLLVVFDGLDEVARGVPPNQVAEYYKALTRSVALGDAKVIVTCRASTDPSSPLLAISQALTRAVDNLLFQSWLLLTRFEPSVVETYVSRYVLVPDQRRDAMARLAATFDLPTLAGTPLLVYLMGHYLALGDPSITMPTTGFELYRDYAEYWTRTELGSRGHSPPEQVAFLHRMSALGLALVQGQRSELPEDQLSEFISRYPWLEAPGQPSPVWREAVSETRGGAMFTVDVTSGNYRFVDSSLAAYFAAEAVLGLLDPSLSLANEDEIQKVLSQVGEAHLSAAALAFLAEGLGTDQAGDELVAKLLSAAPDTASLGPLYHMRLLRQHAEDPEASGDLHPLAPNCRKNMDVIYQGEGSLLQSVRAEPLSQFLASPMGQRYRAVAERPGIVRDNKDGSLWVFVTPASFITGTGSEGGSVANPLTRQQVDRPYLMSVVPLTAQEWSTFATQGGYEAHPAPPGADRDGDYLRGWTRKKDRKGNVAWIYPEGQAMWPITHVSWVDLTAYCQWRSARDGVLVRAPTESEWELVARGTLARRYPWGDLWVPGRSLFKASPLPGPGQVEAYGEGRSPYGAYAIVGSVWQWAYPGTTPDPAVRPVVRGPSWNTTPAKLAIWERRSGPLSPQTRSPEIGVRLRRPAIEEVVLPPDVPTVIVPPAK